MVTASHDLEQTLRRALDSREKADCDDYWMRERIRDAIRAVEPTREQDWYIVFCRECDKDLEEPRLFHSMRGRGRWATGHTVTTGHDRWLVLNWFNVIESVRAPHYESLRCQHGDHGVCGLKCATCDLACRCDCHSS